MTICLLRGIPKYQDFSKGTAVTIGNFDGVHLGHQALLKKLIKKAKDYSIPSVVLLFEPQPYEFFLKDKSPPRLSRLSEKIAALNRLGIDYVCCIKFNEALSQQSPQEFAENCFFSRLKTKYLIIGEDFRFGKNRLGDFSLLQSLGKNFQTEVECFPNFRINNSRVSSTIIRESLGRGDLKEASLFLGEPYTICGKVVHGDARASSFKIPTANIKGFRSKLPLSGVFCVQVKFLSSTSQSYIKGIANFGQRPTVDGRNYILEVHLFDFNKNIYGETLVVQFLHKIRDEMKFSSLDFLIKQIYIDLDKAKSIFANNILENFK